jgi:hypothetical protein
MKQNDYVSARFFEREKRFICLFLKIGKHSFISKRRKK